MASYFRTIRDSARWASEDSKSDRYAFALRSLLMAESVVAIALLACVSIEFNANASIYGISYYGVHLRTVWVLALGFLIGGFFLYRSAIALSPHRPWGLLSSSLRVVAVGLVLLILTPYTLDTFFNWAHMTIGAAIFGFQMLVGFMTLRTMLRDPLAWLGVTVQLIGGVIAALSLPDHMLTYMLQGEIIFQSGFALAINHLLSQEVRRARLDGDLIGGRSITRPNGLSHRTRD